LLFIGNRVDESCYINCGRLGLDFSLCHLASSFIAP
jgi:hypothetical protein